MPLDVLAIGSHPDDVELSCGGLLYKLSEKGYGTGILDLTRGEMGTYGTGETRVKEAEDAAQLLGLEARENMDFGDCRLDQDFEKTKKLADKIRKFQPKLLIIPYGDDTHPDHAAGRKLSERAAFLSKLRKLETDHDPWLVDGKIYYMQHKGFDPSFIADITDVHDKKEEIIMAYESQMKLMTEEGGLLKAINMMNRRYGFMIGVKYGEPFYSDVPLQVEDPVELLK